MLKDAGLRATAPRVMVLRALEGEPHSSVDVVFNRVRADHGTVSTQGVYDVLRACVDAGIVRRIQPAGAPALYELRVDDNHHHLVCRDCGAVVDVDCAVGAAPCLEPMDRDGYEVDEAEVVYWGICPACQAAGASTLLPPAPR
jgi:Fur family ferric uptake transcriptional regulator